MSKEPGAIQPYTRCPHRSVDSEPCEVAAADGNAVPLDELFRLERRLRHLDAERLRLVAARDDAKPSFDDRTTAGRPSRAGRKTLSQETKKLLQSASP